MRRDKDPETLSDAEVEVLLDHAGSPKMRALFALCRWAGLRQGEALNLQVRDIADGVIHIRAKKLEDGSEWRPKSLQRRRISYAGVARLVDELERFERAMGPRMPTAWYLPHDSDQSKRVLDVKEAVRNTYIRAGIEPQGCHVLRRTWATRLGQSGVDVETLRKLGGWSSWEVVRSYVSTDDEALRRAMALGD